MKKRKCAELDLVYGVDAVELECGEFEATVLCKPPIKARGNTKYRSLSNAGSILLPMLHEYELNGGKYPKPTSGVGNCGTIRYGKSVTEEESESTARKDLLELFGIIDIE